MCEIGRVWKHLLSEMAYPIQKFWRKILKLRFFSWVSLKRRKASPWDWGLCLSFSFFGGRLRRFFGNFVKWITQLCIVGHTFCCHFSSYFYHQKAMKHLNSRKWSISWNSLIYQMVCVKLFWAALKAYPLNLNFLKKNYTHKNHKF